MRKNRIAMAVGLAFPLAFPMAFSAHAQTADTPVKNLGVVTIIGGQPTSLPTQIPTTMEGITRAQIEQNINATDSEDAIKYFPSLLVRKRYIGDYNHAILSSRASGTGNSARSAVYADGILLSNYLGNGVGGLSFPPRWGLVTPEEIDRVDVMYGPFSAAYPGNSVGAVVDYVTRMPRQFEAHGKVGVVSQPFSMYNTSETYRAWQTSASVGNKAGDWAWWLNFNHTDKHGHVTITVKMPDSLTRFRIIALATASTNYFGKGENTIVTQRKVNARTIAPRFLTQGDQFSLPVVVQNLDTKPRTVQVAVRAANLTSRGPAGKRVTIPAGQRAEVRFDFATHRRGKAVTQTIMTWGPSADAPNVELPIYEPATTEAFATYGVVDGEPQREKLLIPKDVFPEVGGIEVEVASTQLQSLVDAYWYLQAYPYECAEQRSGRMLATSAMYDILDAFATPGRPTRTELDAQRDRDVIALGKTQNADGGWGYFGGMRSDPTVSMQVVSALGASKATGPVVQRATAFATKEMIKAFDDLRRRLGAPERKPTPDEDTYLVSFAAAALTNLASIGQDMRGRAEQLHAVATAVKAYPVDA